MHDDHLCDPDEEQGQVEEEREFEAEALEKQDTIAEGSHQESNNDGADIELRHIYEASSTDIIPIHQNPMHDPGDIGNNDRNIATVQAQNMELENKNADLEFESKNAKGQIRMLQQRIKDLESQARNHQMNDGNL